MHHFLGLVSSVSGLSIFHALPAIMAKQINSLTYVIKSGYVIPEEKKSIWKNLQFLVKC